ncbi:leucine-rich repeat receptor-like serine/threonine/tyrosine-protein kinase SOBIR1 [Tanacetum coccineum]
MEKKNPSVFLDKKNPFAFLEKVDAVSSLEITKRGGSGEVYKAKMPDGVSGTHGTPWPRTCIGVPFGLKYLHLIQTPGIVHRDLKPTNMLLDDDMEVRIVDFGLAKSIPHVDTHMTSSNVAGTMRYIALTIYKL